MGWCNFRKVVLCVLLFVLFAYRLSLACPQGCGVWFRQHCCRPTNIKKTSKEEQSDDGTKVEQLPFMLAIGLLIFWIWLCSTVFMIFEKDWTYFTAVYFFFISLTTIG